MRTKWNEEGFLDSDLSKVKDDHLTLEVGEILVQRRCAKTANGENIGMIVEKNYLQSEHLCDPDQLPIFVFRIRWSNGVESQKTTFEIANYLDTGQWERKKIISM